MQRTFRLGRHNLIVAIWCELCFGLIVIGCLLLSLLDPERPFAWLVMAAFWFMWVLLAGYEIMASYRTRLVIDGPRLLEKGVFSSRELLLDDATRLDWRSAAPRGTVVARSSTTRVSIPFHALDSQDRVPLIEHLRSALPEAQQSGWNLFCVRCALPLLEPSIDSCRSRTTRRDIDRLFAWMLVPSLCVTAFLIWMDGWKYWPSIFVLTPLWLILRFMVPSKGMRGTPISEQPGTVSWAVSFAGIFVGMVVSGWSLPLAVLIWIVAVTFFVRFCRAAHRENVRKREEQEEQAKTADARWQAALAEYKHSAP